MILEKAFVINEIKAAAIFVGVICFQCMLNNCYFSANDVIVLEYSHAKLLLVPKPRSLTLGLFAHTNCKLHQYGGMESNH